MQGWQLIIAIGLHEVEAVYCNVFDKRVRLNSVEVQIGWILNYKLSGQIIKFPTDYMQILPVK